MLIQNSTMKAMLTVLKSGMKQANWWEASTGVRINRFFAGESMFHIQTDASKVALMHLVELMTLDGMELLDTQWRTEHLETLGCIAIPREEYLQLLASAIAP